MYNIVRTTNFLVLPHNCIGTFIQALEGEADIDKIRHDKRHSYVNILNETEISTLNFALWVMKFKNLENNSAKNLKRIFRFS
ncbi:BLUF domain-containing protein [Colwellia sp. UCD-KL20]|uniref:BLUF domain-containing protein n=1 Tax=Colwellia sp. UCD-KL20 TaxID=1917165 RepID=UPI000970ABD9